MRVLLLITTLFSWQSWLCQKLPAGNVWSNIRYEILGKYAEGNNVPFNSLQNSTYWPYVLNLAGSFS